jgi:hypothetical protein
MHADRKLVALAAQLPLQLMGLSSDAVAYLVRFAFHIGTQVMCIGLDLCRWMLGGMRCGQSPERK